jgi:hypothetical protein
VTKKLSTVPDFHCASEPYTLRWLDIKNRILQQHM